MKIPNQVFITFLILLMISSCGEKNSIESEMDNIEDCKIEEEFYTRMLINGECWTSSFEYFYFAIENNVIVIRMRKEEKFEEHFSIIIPINLVIGDRVVLTGNKNLKIDMSVTEGIDALVVRYDPRYNLDEEENWVIIDRIDADSTIISGKFETILYSDIPQGSQSIYGRPDKLIITDGEFRVKRTELRE